MQKLLNSKIVLGIIILIAAVLRILSLNTIPPHLTPDEASLGYNAYSILKTGRDEYGSFLPVIFKSFGDYKPGLYVYLTVPFVAAIGLNEWSVRLPSAAAGIAVVYLVYLIGSSLLGKKLGLIAAFIASITPWLIYFSRGAWEVNVSLALTLAGIYFFLEALKKPRLLILSAIFFSLTLFSYQGAKLSTGIVIILLVLLYKKELMSQYLRRSVISSLILGIIVSLPIMLSFFSGKTGRLNVFSVFSYSRPAEYLQNFLDQGDEKAGSLSYYLFHSESLNFTRGIMGRWFNHFSGRFLFFEGDWQNPRHSAPYQGVLLISDIVLVLAGLAVLLKKNPSREVVLVMLWLILASLPSALSRDQVHAVRSLNMAIPLVFVLAFGLNALVSTNKRVLQTAFLAFYIASFVYFSDAYFIHVPKHDSNFWEYGYKQIVEIITPIQKNYKEVRVQQSYAQPYIFFLFYGAATNPQKYDPAKYQAAAKLTENASGDVGQVEHLDNIYFAPIDWSVDRGRTGVLFAADTIRIPPDDSKDAKLFNVIKEIKYLNGRDIAFRIVEVR